MRSIGRTLFKYYRIASIVIITVGTIGLIISKGHPEITLTILLPLVLIVLLVLCVATLVDMIRRGGRRAFVQVLYTTRFRLTLWYAFILALALLIFSSIIYEAVTNDLNNATYASLRTRLTQVANTYDAKRGRLSLALNSNGNAAISSSGDILERKPVEDDVALLVTPQGQILQMTQGYENELAALAALTVKTWAVQKDQNAYLLQKVPLGQAGTTNIQAYEFGSLHSYSLAGVSYVFDQAALLNQQHQAQALLVVGIPSDVSGWLSDLISVMAMTLPLMVLLSCMGGYWLAGRAMRPVLEITRTAQQISETDLHRRLKLKQRDELGELAATFDTMLDRLQAAFDRQRQFTADASHELRTPLSIVDLEAERALKQEHTAVEYRQAIENIQQENRHMARLVNDLLVLARADAGHAQVRHEQIDLGEVIVDTVDRLVPLAQQTGVAIQVAPLSELIIAGDHVYLAQLFTNIIENALKYSAGSGTRVEINLSEQSKNGRAWAVTRVQDDGPGIANEHLPHLFERFYRVDQSRTHNQDGSSAGERPPGNGLGLSIAEWIARAHGGAIQVCSTPGQGSAFEIWLPLEAKGADQQTNNATHSRDLDAKTTIKKEKSRMSQQMNDKERSYNESPQYEAGYQEAHGYNSYATAFGSFGAGQKLTGITHRLPTAGQRLALAIVSLGLWVFTLFGLVGIALASRADSSVGWFILFGMILFSALIAVINIVFNRS